MNYRKILVDKHAKIREAAPSPPEKPLDYMQHQNHKNLRAWRKRLAEHEGSL